MEKFGSVILSVTLLQSYGECSGKRVSLHGFHNIHVLLLSLTKIVPMPAYFIAKCVTLFAVTSWLCIGTSVYL